MSSKFILDRNAARELQLSNDAFFYLLEDEEPLDEANLEEAQEILEMFPDGFEIDENWFPVEDSDLIEAVFIPYVLDNADYDEFLELSKSLQAQIKWIGFNAVQMWYCNALTGAREFKGEFAINVTDKGSKYFHTGDQNGPFKAGHSCLFFLNSFKKKP